MPTVRDILDRKGSDVVAMPPTASVLEAARLMNARGIGSVLVMDQGAVVGIFTERDVLRRVVAERREPPNTTLGEVMTASLVTGSATTSIAECVGTMTRRRIRHLPILDGDRLVGLVTSGDVLAFQLAEQESTIQHLNSYVYDVR